MKKNLKTAIAAAMCAVPMVACVAKPQPPSCSFTGEKYLPDGMAAGEICPAFEAQLDTALNTASPRVSQKDWIIAINVSPAGSIEAKVRQAGQANAEELPSIAVDVMDRDIEKRDFDQLANTVAQILMKQ